MKAVLKSFLCVVAITSTFAMAQADGSASLPMPPRLQKPVSASLPVRCIQAFTKNGYSLSPSFVTESCARVSNIYSVQSIEALTETQADISASLMYASLNITSELGFNCVKSFKNQGYNISEMVVNNCSRVSNTWSLRAIYSLTSTRNEISASVLEALLQINGPQSFRCVKQLADAGYNIGSTVVITGCRYFNSAAANEALRAIVASKQDISLSTLQQLGMIQ